MPGESQQAALNREGAVARGSQKAGEGQSQEWAHSLQPATALHRPAVTWLRWAALSALSSSEMGTGGVPE